MATLVKRQRATNFSVAETDCLLNEVLKRKAVIENKRTDAITWKQKDDAWKDLAETFNTLTGTNRTEKMIRIKYDGLKRAVKQKYIKLKAEKTKTGGGTAEIIQFSASEEKLMGVMLLSIEGLPTKNDCDSGNPCTWPEDVVDDVESMLVDFEDGNNDIIQVIPTDNKDQQTPIEDNIRSENIKVINVTKNTTGNANWNSWTPATLRAPRNKKLRTTRITPRVSSQYSSMANSREELIGIQKKVAEQELAKLQLEIEYLHKEEARNEKESQLRMQLARNEFEAKMELIKLQKEQLLFK